MPRRGPAGSLGEDTLILRRKSRVAGARAIKSCEDDVAAQRRWLPSMDAGAIPNEAPAGCADARDLPPPLGWLPGLPSVIIKSSLSEHDRTIDRHIDYQRGEQVTVDRATRRVHCRTMRVCVRGLERLACWATQEEQQRPVNRASREWRA
jgi:hypothetical protein